MSEENPFAAPQSLPETPVIVGPRTGPRWEQTGFVLMRLLGTVADCLGARWVEFFRTMRREGGYFAPLAFCVLSSLLFGSVGGLIENLLELGRNETDWEAIFWTQVGIVLLMPPLVALQLFMVSALHHAVLYMLRGARHPFETTFRVVAYSTGSAMPFAMIPRTSGTVLNLAAMVAFIAVGLCQAHEISKGKAIAAVTLSFTVCIGGLVIAVLEMNALGLLDWLSELIADE